MRYRKDLGLACRVRIVKRDNKSHVLQEVGEDRGMQILAVYLYSAHVSISYQPLTVTHSGNEFSVVTGLSHPPEAYFVRENE